jgi:hypothetical protein
LFIQPTFSKGIQIMRKSLSRMMAISRRPVRQHEQAEDPELSMDQKLAMAQSLVEMLYLPILRGEANIRDCITPPGGWERLDAIYGDVLEMPIERQLALAIHG